MKKTITKRKKKKTVIKKQYSMSVSPETVEKHNLSIENTGENNIFRMNLKPCTSHLPTLFISVLIPHLKEIYDKYPYFKCRKY